MFLLALLACGPGTFTTRDGTESIRGALYFAPDTTLSLELNGSRQIWILLANSTLPCAPEDVEDDPTTATDEVAAAKSYWAAQVATAFAREGALSVAMVLGVGAEEDWLGRYSFHSDAWDADAAASYVATDGKVAAGAWYRVVEAAVEEGNGVLYADQGAITTTEEEHDLEIGAPAWVDVTRKDTELAGTFSFAPASLTGEFKAERCDNLDLLSDLYLRLAVLALTEDAEELPDTGWEWDED